MEQALLATLQIADRADWQCTVAVPGTGREMVLPFRVDGPDPVRLEVGDARVMLSTSLLFPVDDAIRSHSRWSYPDPVRIGGVDHVAIGFIYLSVSLGRRYAELAFGAATTDMSVLFVDSPSIQRRFLDLLRSSDGLVGFIDLDSDECRFLADPAQGDQRFRLGEDRRKAGVDRFAHALLAVRDSNRHLNSPRVAQQGESHSALPT